MKTCVRLNLSLALLKACRSHCSAARLFSIAVILVAIAMGAPLLFAQESQARKEIDAFNQEYTAAHLKMDNAAVISMWAEDGVTLLPGMEPLSGRTNIGKWLNDITARMPGYRVVKQQNDFHDILISGDWASECCSCFIGSKTASGGSSRRCGTQARVRDALRGILYLIRPSYFLLLTFVV